MKLARIFFLLEFKNCSLKKFQQRALFVQKCFDQFPIRFPTASRKRKKIEATLSTLICSCSGEGPLKGFLSHCAPSPQVHPIHHAGSSKPGHSEFYLDRSASESKSQNATKVAASGQVSDGSEEFSSLSQMT